jgi:uncharacterized protein (TIGR02145 family)
MKKNFLNYPLLLMGVLLIFLSGCKKDDDVYRETTFADPRDGYVYKTVKLGRQVWMAENLRYLPAVAGAGTGSATSPYYYVYDYNGTNVTNAKATANYLAYGVLYNWKAAMNACPAGWHLPGDAEWTELENYLADNGYSYDGTTGGGRAKIAKALAGTGGWVFSANAGATGNDDYPEYRNKSGFTALPGGGVSVNYTFVLRGVIGFWWNENATAAAVRSMHHEEVSVSRSENISTNVGFSIRCVKD